MEVPLRDYTHLTYRPEKNDRLFTSSVVEDTITETVTKIADPNLKRMFIQCYPNSLDTTTYHFESSDDGNPDTFVVTGDIPAMWLRDSTNQLWPYIKFANREEKLRRMFAGLVFRQVKCVLVDPYANAFKFPYMKNPPKTSHWPEGDGWHDDVWERKYELDSLAAFFRLSNGYYENTGDPTPFDEKWVQAVDIATDVIYREQNTLNYKSLDSLHRATMPNGESFLATPVEGYGYPSNRSGLSRNLFRPSDDEAVFPFHIPANAMAVVGLRGIARILSRIDQPSLAQRTRGIAQTINSGIQQYGVVQHRLLGSIYAYEVDGFGSQLLMDDPNVPSLLSLPYLGYTSIDSPTYRATRRFVTSQMNPFFAEGHYSGITSPHCGRFNKFWPIATIMQAMTSNDDTEIISCLKTLKETHAGTQFMHESINVDNPDDYTRPWFGWANSLFGEMILDLVERKPEILSKEIE
jgi:meiotically up-regulated gene 157 (Mug157) protein